MFHLEGPVLLSKIQKDKQVLNIKHIEERGKARKCLSFLL